MAVLIARRVVLGWLSGLGLAVLVGVPAEAKRLPRAPRKQGVYVDDYVDRYA
jgi:hypothetical protein